MGPSMEKREALAQRLKDLGVEKKDLEERFIKASGRGGQKVNKRSSAVYIRHVPTGLSVKYGRHRSQDLNRFMALRLLAEKIETKTKKNSSPAKKIISKRRKQKQRNRARSKKKYQNQKDKKAFGTAAKSLELSGTGGET